MKKVQLVVCLAACIVVARPVFADASGTVSISAIRDFGDLTPVSYCNIPAPFTFHTQSFTVDSVAGDGGGSLTSNTLASVTNDTGNSITLGASPSCDLNASGSSDIYRATSSASISLSGSTASGMCSGLFGSYGLGAGCNVLYKKFWDTGSHTFSPNGGNMVMTGTWSISVYGG